MELCDSFPEATRKNSGTSPSPPGLTHERYI